MHHSWYWRSPHFTREEAYFFALAGEANLAETLAAKDGLEQAKPTELEPATSCFEKPSWFAAKGARSYEIWIHLEGTTLILREKGTDRVFLHSCQM